MRVYTFTGLFYTSHHGLSTQDMKVYRSLHKSFDKLAYRSYAKYVERDRYKPKEFDILNIQTYLAVLSPQLNMCLCVHVCIYICMCSCVYACMHVCMYVCMHVLMYVCVAFTCMRVCTYACIQVCMLVEACVHV